MGKMPAGLARYHAARRASKGGAVVVVTKSSPARRRPRKSHHKRRARRGSHGGAGVRMVPLAIASAGLAYLVSANGPDFVRNNLAKIPGTKTFGPIATAGLVCLAADRFVKRNKWLKLAGLAGLVVAAAQLGTQGGAFKWIGDDSSGDFDLSDEGTEGDDDMGDDD